ncbi:leucine-rich repeat-containing protein 20 isoform X4 [Chrysemys picta bellii]|uniref:leucine-rich repeat-containing protein 20 isoform X4 n=1 Tax=Chrysemys picta bellii TaxID=8478 RepID=UPI0032B2BA78
MHVSPPLVAQSPEWLPAVRRLFPLWKCFPGGTGCGACMEKKMGEAVARVARKVNETVENGAESLDLADCKLMMFPIGIYKVMRNVTEGIHLITLANNELKSVTSKFITTFSQMRAANVSPSQRLVKIRRRKRRTWDDMFLELQMSSQADRAQQNAWRQSMSECKKAQYEREERWRAESRAEESKWWAEEDKWHQLADRRQRVDALAAGASN